MRPVLLAPVLLAAFLPRLAPAAPLTPQERRGKDLYLRGTSEQDEGAQAYLRGADMDVPAAVMPCANCHGRDGRGKVEGSVNAPDITWAQLTRRATHSHAGGRTHGPHSVLTLGSAITRGVDPDGHGIDAAMPLYRFSPAGLDALVAYLQKLGSERDPGIEPRRLVVGTAAPAGLGPAREAQAVWRALFDHVNASGGIHGRRLELRAAEAVPGSGAAGIGAAVGRLLGDDGVFALLGVFVAEPSDDLAALLREREAPLIGPFTLHPRRRRPPERETFYLAAGLVDQARALLKTLRTRDPGAVRVAVVWPDEPGEAALAEELAAECARLGLKLVVKSGRARAALASPATLHDLRAASADVLLLPGWRGEEIALLDAAAAAGFRPHVLLPGYAGGAAALGLPAAFDQRVLLGLALPPFDPARTDDDLARRLFAGRRPSPTALVAFRAARLLVEGLRRAGRDVSRDSFVTTLEGLYDFDLGVGPKVSFGPNRRIGAPGAHVVALDLKQRAFVPLGEWTGAE